MAFEERWRSVERDMPYSSGGLQRMTKLSVEDSNDEAEATWAICHNNLGKCCYPYSRQYRPNSLQGKGESTSNH